jgi:anti-sigma factor RsiW
MAGVTLGELAALADDALPPSRRSEVEAAVAVSPRLQRMLAAQRRGRGAVRAAAASVTAPAHLRNPCARRRP